MSGPSTRRRIKQEQQEGMASSSGAGGGGTGFFDSLDILATIATQELKSKSDKVGAVTVRSSLEIVLSFSYSSLITIINHSIAY